jgi:hypothetical protein
MANSYTTFPDSVQTFDIKTDISSSVYSDWVKYNSYISKGEFANATQLLQSNTELQKCIVDSVYMNKMSKTVEEIQTLFLNDVQRYIHETITNKGDWSSTVKYVKYDFVTYLVNGIVQTFECLSDATPISTLPTNTTYWIPRVIQGEKGASGLGLTPRGVWNNIALYMVNDFVSYDSSFWQCLNQNSNSEPSDTNTNWLRLINLSEELMTKINEVIDIEINSLRSEISNQLLTSYAPTIHTHAVNQITDFPTFPTSLPANGGNSDTVDNQHVVLNDAMGLKPVQFSTTDLIAGTSSLATGTIYFVYE